LTLPVNGIETVVDEAAQVAVVDSRGKIRDDRVRRAEEAGVRRKERHGHGHGMRDRGRDGKDARFTSAQGVNWREIWSHGTDAVMDVPLAGVCEVLYGEGRQRDEEEESSSVS
jgi:hypothetical protein